MTQRMRWCLAGAVLVLAAGCGSSSWREEGTTDAALVERVYDEKYKFPGRQWNTLPPLTDGLRQIAGRGDRMIEHLKERFDGWHDSMRTIRVMCEMKTPAAHRFLLVHLTGRHPYGRRIAYALFTMTGDEDFWRLAKWGKKSGVDIVHLRTRWETKMATENVGK
ncbi:MAG: hypothetical protein ACYTAF_03420 [Planctomycetota bacterium]|jgi:hypothetical protein